MSTLAELPSGARAQVASLPAHHGLARRLIALGLIPGSEVCVLQNRGRGPLIVEAHGARIALGRNHADRVMIDLDPHPCEPLAESSDGIDEPEEKRPVTVEAIPVETTPRSTGR